MGSGLSDSHPLGEASPRTSLGWRIRYSPVYDKAGDTLNLLTFLLNRHNIDIVDNIR
jgi:hypothetical protein